MSPVLFYGVPQGSSFGAIVALEWLGAPYRLCRMEMRERPWDALYGQLNPLYQTPTLLSASGVPIAQSLAILLHLAGQGSDRQPGVRPGTAAFDRLAEMLAYLHTDFFAAFNPLWVAIERDDLSASQKMVQRLLGRKDVAAQCRYLNGLLDGREWLLGGSSPSLADAYASGIGRWIVFHTLFDLPRDYPHLHRYLERLEADPAVAFAHAIEDGRPVQSAGGFNGHVTLAELQPRLRVA